MGNCIAAPRGVEQTRKPASVVGSVGHLGSGNEDNVTVTSFGNESASMANHANSVAPHMNTSVGIASLSSATEEADKSYERRQSLTPSLARSEEADGAVIQGYAEPQAFRILRRQNDQSSIEALQKALRDDPNMNSTKLKLDSAPSRRPTALGVPNMQ